MVKRYKYLQLFHNNLHKQITLSEFEKYFQKPHQTIKSHLEPLVKNKILIEEKKTRIRQYSLNLENPLTKEYLIISQKEKLFTFLESNSFMKILYNELSEFFTDSKILIFGSATNQKDYNDIDILIISENTNIKKKLQKIEETYSKTIHLLQTNKSSLTPTLIKEIKKNHIILNSHEYFIEVIYNEFRVV